MGRWLPLALPPPVTETSPASRPSPTECGTSTQRGWSSNASQRPNNPANGDQGSRNYPGGEGARPVVEPMTLAEQIAHLRQLAIADPNTTLLELAIINVLDEFAEAVQNLAGNEPRGLGSV